MAALSANKTLLFDDHTKPHHEVTVCQMAMFVVYVAVTFLYIARKPQRLFLFWSKKIREPDVEKARGTNHVDEDAQKRKPSNGSDEKAGLANEVKPTVPPPPTFDDFLRYFIGFGIILMYYFLCDYIKVFPTVTRVYSRDTFLFLVFLLFLVGCVFTIRPTTKDTILNREQTEEWKGWMQVMFVWYHYFAAAEWYNWIRVYIACYVWMTGFGNFSFFWVRKDFSWWRVLKMMFRLNFLVIFVAMTTNNEYMLYYICAMHTYWFVTVYVFMRVLNHWNEDRFKMAAKFVAFIVFNALIFEIPGVCSTVFYPLWFIFGFHEQKYGLMHEWEFRAGLDHWACLTGMLCAYNYPHFEAAIKYLERETSTKKEQLLKLIGKVSMVTVALVIGVLWYMYFMRKEKYDYNKSHSYSSMIPILVFIVLRNSFAVLRRFHIHLFAWLGKITLETYLSQLHVYLQSNARHLLGYFSDSPLLNFASATIVYLTVSYFLFHITVEVSAYLIPKDRRVVLKHITIGVVLVSIATFAAFWIQFSLGGHILI